VLLQRIGASPKNRSRESQPSLTVAFKNSDMETKFQVGGPWQRLNGVAGLWARSGPSGAPILLGSRKNDHATPELEAIVDQVCRFVPGGFRIDRITYERRCISRRQRVSDRPVAGEYHRSKADHQATAFLLPFAAVTEDRAATGRHLAATLELMQRGGNSRCAISVSRTGDNAFSDGRARTSLLAGLRGRVRGFRAHGHRLMPDGCVRRCRPPRREMGDLRPAARAHA